MKNRLYIRDSYLLNVNKRYIESQIQKKREEIFKIFVEKDPSRLHSLILNSKILNKFAESRLHPHTSYKYHLLLTCAIYWNFKNASKWKQLYLCENGKMQSQFQVIYKDEDRVWALTPEAGMSRVSPEFCKAWVRRTQLSLGGDDTLDGLLSTIKSWSAALATIEDWQELNE